MEDMDELMKLVEARLQKLKDYDEDDGDDEAAYSGEEILSQLIPIIPTNELQSTNQVPDYFMVFNFPQGIGRPPIRGMRGEFRITDDHIVFAALTKRKNTIEVDCSFCATSVFSLINFLSSKEYIVEIIGKSKDDIFYVNEIHIISGKPDPKEFPTAPFCLRDSLFQLMLKRKRALTQSNEEADSIAQKTIFSSSGELKLLYETCKTSYPASIRDWAENNLSVLSSAQVGSTDKRHILKALSYILNVDWSLRPPTVPDLGTVREVLDRRFYGLEPVKQRIMEIAAQIRSTQSLPKWGILLNGPAGVGKTSIANAISEILSMPKAYLEFSVLRDSEALTGSSRIYDNGKPGMIIEQIFARGTASLVMVLNEIDKSANGKDRGNPLDTLLPLLDGMGFTDTYIETPIPTDGIFFIATCNDPEKISKPVLDRFYRIDIPAYSADEKEVILDQYILPQSLRQANIEPQELTISDSARKCLFTQYALEPGVRDLERFAEKLISHYLLLKESKGLSDIIFSADDICSLLGPAKAISRNFSMFPGVVFSAFCHDGGVHVFSIQALVRPGGGKLKLINIDSAIQKEYCQMAYECANLLTNNKLSKFDVVLAAMEPICASTKNYIGCAACSAILAAIKGVAYSSDELFLGGCDLFGNLYLDEKTIDSYLKQLSGQFTTIYGAIGTSKLVYEHLPNVSISIVETPNMGILFELSGSQGRKK